MVPGQSAAVVGQPASATAQQLQHRKMSTSRVVYSRARRRFLGMHPIAKRLHTLRELHEVLNHVAIGVAAFEPPLQYTIAEEYCHSVNLESHE